MSETLTTRQAARRVNRHIRTIHRWRSEGMEVDFDKVGHMHVDLDELLDWYRHKTVANPVHKYRLRKKIQSMELTP
ncbi:Hypotetical protein [Gulosibacter molinativorax]|nr:Hypotetical protein [Gulosibacter molinativorax]